MGEFLAGGPLGGVVPRHIVLGGGGRGRAVRAVGVDHRRAVRAVGERQCHLRLVRRRALATRVHRPHLEGVGRAVGQLGHRKAPGVGRAHPAVGDVDPVAVAAGAFFLPILTLRDRVAATPDPIQHHLPVARRRRQISRGAGRELGGGRGRPQEGRGEHHGQPDEAGARMTVRAR